MVAADQMLDLSQRREVIAAVLLASALAGAILIIVCRKKAALRKNSYRANVHAAFFRVMNSVCVAA